MNAIYSLFIAKRQCLSKENELEFDVKVTSSILAEVNVINLIRNWIEHPHRLEIHISFQSIPNERRNQVILGVKCAFTIMSKIVG